MKFFSKGIRKFMMQLDKIVDEVYEVPETELSSDYQE